MYGSKAAVMLSILGLFASIPATARAQNCACVDATNPPYCVVADAQCWVSLNFYNNHIAESQPNAKQKMLEASTTGDRRQRSTYFVPLNASFYKALRTASEQAGKSTLTAGAAAAYYDCSINPQNTAECVTTRSSQYSVCSTNGKITHLMSTQNTCQ
jgi:hypothetical protein